MTEPRHRHRGASYVASASDGIMKTSHKVYASSSDDDSPAGFLQSAYNSPPASPRCAPRRQVDDSVTESEEDVSESPDAFVVELTRSDNFWTQRVRWYLDKSNWRTPGLNHDLHTIPRRLLDAPDSLIDLCTGGTHLLGHRERLTPAGAGALVHLVGIVLRPRAAGALFTVSCCVHEPLGRCSAARSCVEIKLQVPHAIDCVCSMAWRS